ncbi:unnamed protein product [Prorocentrum cordatum]|uniref:GAF domain-containing protein n=1 Tax=Prorocentrum cordatum TaxID=2364126 RepID=A0ABN9Q4A6_9DINO|nr:unnamed protein product [Polarella glacialis]
MCLRAAGGRRCPRRASSWRRRRRTSTSSGRAPRAPSKGGAPARSRPPYVAGPAGPGPRGAAAQGVYARFLAEAAKKNTVCLLREAIAEGGALGLGEDELGGAASALRAREEHLVSLGEMYTSKDSIRKALEGGDPVLLKGSWLAALGRSGGKLPRRQDLPPEAVWDPEALMPRVHDSAWWNDSCFAIRDGVGLVGILYCWEAPEHPDPRGEQLRLLAGLAERRTAHMGRPLQ